MRKLMIAGNWKMNNTIGSSIKLIEDLKTSIKVSANVDVVVCPPYTALSDAAKRLEGSPIALGAQNAYFEADGAFTGEISLAMLEDCRCRYVIIGHSERRAVLGEDNALLNKKLKAVIATRLTAIFCVGETLTERENGKTFEVIKKQLDEGMENITAGNLSAIVIAYEPVWAIGTGKTATPDQAQEVHGFIRQWLRGKYGQEKASSMRILYGGSVKPDNTASLIEKEDIDGALVGGASLKADSFAQIVKAAG